MTGQENCEGDKTNSETYKNVLSEAGEQHDALKCAAVTVCEHIHHCISLSSAAQFVLFSPVFVLSLVRSVGEESRIDPDSEKRNGGYL